MLFHSFGGERMMKRGDEYEERKGINVAKFQNQPPQLTQKLECHSEEVEVDSRSSGGGGGSGDPKKQIIIRRGSSGGGDGGDGASIEVVKRPRGRPPGSKNKPKPPVVITREAPDSAAALRPHVLEIPAGHDVLETLARFSRRRNLGICVLAGSGLVSNITLRQPSLSHPPSASSAGASPPPHYGSTVTFHGRFEILSISATFFPPSFAPSPAIGVNSGGFSISLAGPQGQIVGGSVAGSLMAAGTVTVVAAAFSNPTYHLLPAEDEASASALMPVSTGGGGGDGGEMEAGLQLHHHAAVSTAAPSASDYYSCHLPTDVIWAPTARPPHPPPY